MPAATATAATAADLLLFGVPRIVRGGTTLNTGTRKALLLLALLALDGPQPRDSLAARLWPDLDPAAARRNLRRDLFRLREKDCAPIESASGALAAAPHLRSDVQAFHAALAAGDDETALRHSAARVLDGLDGGAGSDVDDWIDRWRQRLLRERASARERLAARLERQGEFGAALAWLQEALFEDPCDERAARHAMRLHALAGDRAAAAQVYRRLAAALRDELDTPPSEETAALVRQLGIDEPAPAASPPPATPTQATPPPPALDLTRLRFVGRSEERARITAAWQSGRSVYVSGLPGSGKTRLVTECAAAAGSWLRLVCTPFDASAPFGFAVRALRTLREADPAAELPRWVRRELAALLPEWGEPAPRADEAGAAERLRQAFAEAWRVLVRDNFNTIVCDDWQWCDSDSAALLDPLFASPAPATVRIFRTAQLDARALGQLRHDVDGGRAEHVVLEGLRPAETAELIAAAACGPAPLQPRVFAAELHDATEGNPFYLLETLHALREAQGSCGVQRPLDASPIVLPPTVRDAVLDRANAIGDAARRLLEAASLLPEPFAAASLDGVTPQAGAEEVVALLEAADAARLVERDGDGYRFSHDLVRDSLQAGLSPARRSLLHERLARRLEANDGAAALIAAHWEGAGRLAAAAPWRLRAAREAHRVNAPAEAERHYRLALADGASGRDAVAAHLALAELDRRQDRSAQQAYDDAVAAAQHADAPTFLEARLAQLRYWVDNRRPQDAMAALDAMVPLVDAASPLLRATALELRALAAYNDGDYPTARDLQDRAIALLDGCGDALAARQRLLDEAARMAFRCGDGARALELARVALACAEAIGDDYAAALALVVVGLCEAHFRNDRGTAALTFERARALGQRCGSVVAQRMAMLNLVKVHTDAGEVDRALRTLDEIVALTPFESADRRDRSLVDSARYFLHYLRGDVAAARAAAQELIGSLPALHVRHLRLAARQLVADLYLHTGDVAAAAAVLEDPDAATADHELLHTLLEAKRAWLDLVRGDPRRASERLRALSAAPRPQDRAIVAWVGAAAALALDDVAAAQQWLQPIDVESDCPSDMLAMLLTQRLRLAARSRTRDDAAAARAQRLLEAGQVPALEATFLREALAAAGASDAAPDGVCASVPGTASA